MVAERKPVPPQSAAPSFSLERLRELRQADEDERCAQLLRDCRSLERLEEIDNPEWDPPAIEDKTRDIDVARMLLRDALGNSEPDDWDEARVWREMYEHTYAIADRLRAIAQKLDDKLDEGIKGLGQYNAAIDDLSAAAHRLQCDLNL